MSYKCDPEEFSICHVVFGSYPIVTDFVFLGLGQEWVETPLKRIQLCRNGRVTSTRTKAALFALLLLVCILNGRLELVQLDVQVIQQTPLTKFHYEQNPVLTRYQTVR